MSVNNDSLCTLTTAFSCLDADTLTLLGAFFSLLDNDSYDMYAVRGNWMGHVAL